MTSKSAEYEVEETGYWCEKYFDPSKNHHNRGGPARGYQTMRAAGDKGTKGDRAKAEKTE